MKARDSAHLTSHAMNALKRRGFIERKPVQVSDGIEQHTSENLFLTRSGADWLIRYTRRASTGAPFLALSRSLFLNSR